MGPIHKSGLVFDERYLNHDTGEEAQVVLRDGTFELDPEAHPSSLLIIRRIKQFLDRSGLSAQMQKIEARPALEEELAVFHTPDYIAGVQAYAQGGPAKGPWGEFDDETRLSPGSFEAALYAAGGAIEAVDAVMQGRVRNSYALLRPPGHHAMRNQGLGFCIFNNMVVAAEHARRRYGLERVMIVDWDVHHGNGIQDAFYGDPGVLFVSLHQEDWFPENSGLLEQVGFERGIGYTVNVPLPPGTGDRGYLAAFEQLVVPLGRLYQPQLLLVSAGQDASWLDPLAQMMVTMAGFRQLSEQIVRLADEVCEGRLVVLQEGGYSPAYVPFCTAAVVEGLLGCDLGIVDLYAESSELKRCQAVFSQETQQALARARAWHQQWWKLP